MKSLHQRSSSFFFSCLLVGMTSALAWAEPPEGQDVRRDYSPTVAPDGAHMAWYSYRGDANPDIWVASVDGVGEHNLTASAETWDIEPDWSPDGRWIAFARGLSMRRLDIYVIGADGSGLRQVTQGETSESAPSWAPDGRRLAHTVFSPGPVFTSRIDSVDVETGETARLVPETVLGREGQAYAPAWSPDGRFLAFAFDASEDPNVGADLYLLEIETGEIRRLTHTNWHEISPAWSADGARLYFSSDQSGIARRIHAFDMDNHRDLSDPAFEISQGYGDQYFVTVAADGRVYYDMRNPLYGAGDPGERDVMLYRVGPTGGHAEQLTDYAR